MGPSVLDHVARFRELLNTVIRGDHARDFLANHAAVGASQRAGALDNDTLSPDDRDFLGQFNVPAMLGWVGANPPEGMFVAIGRIATAYYFFHFIILIPLLGIFERPKPVPTSIPPTKP